MAQQTRAPMGTLAEERSHAVMAGGAVVAGRAGAVIDVLTAVVAHPAVDAHTAVAAVGVVACSSVLACIGHQLALIHIVSAVLTCVLRWALAVVGVDSIHTHATILTVVTWTVINVVLTVLACKP